MKVGYRRVSIIDQNLERQDLGEVDRVFEEKVSGKKHGSCRAAGDGRVRSGRGRGDRVQHRPSRARSSRSAKHHQEGNRQGRVDHLAVRASDLHGRHRRRVQSVAVAVAVAVDGRVC